MAETGVDAGLSGDRCDVADAGVATGRPGAPDCADEVGADPGADAIGSSSCAAPVLLGAPFDGKSAPFSSKSSTVMLVELGELNTGPPTDSIPLEELRR